MADGAFHFNAENAEEQRARRSEMNPGLKPACFCDPERAGEAALFHVSRKRMVEKAVLHTALTGEDARRHTF